MDLFQNYVKIDEIAKLWGLSTRRVQILCAEGRIQGAMRFGREWMIPKDAEKPADGRTKSGRMNPLVSPNMPMPRKTPFLHMTDLYGAPGKAEESIRALSDNPEAQMLFAAGIHYAKGEIDKVYDHTYYLLGKHSGFYSVISAGMLLAMSAIWRGDLNLWRQAKIHIAEAPAKNEEDMDLMAFSLVVVDSMLYDVYDFPEWFKIGRFDPVHKDALPVAKMAYAKYLYASAFSVATKEVEVDGLHGLTLMSLIPSTIEPMISQAKADGSVIAELYLRLNCASVYHNFGNEEQAIFHIDKAIELALPDRLFGILAEYRRTLDSLLEQRLNAVDPSLWREIKPLYEIYVHGWSKLSGSVRGKNIATTLSPRQREVAKFAAFGLKNEEIASLLHMSVSAVKLAIANVSSKTGMSRKEFAAIL